jgi:hypothetical protein
MRIKYELEIEYNDDKDISDVLETIGKFVKGAFDLNSDDLRITPTATILEDK